MILTDVQALLVRHQGINVYFNPQQIIFRKGTDTYLPNLLNHTEAKEVQIIILVIFYYYNQFQ